MWLNPLDLRRLKRFDLMGPPCPPRLRPKPPFVQRWDVCEKHGRYPLNMQDEKGNEYAHPAVCPACTAQTSAASQMAGSNIPARFVSCTFENFVADTEDKAQVLAICRAYADQFRGHRDAGRGLILCGTVGTGKNHLATAVSKVVLASRFSVLRVKASQFLEETWAKPFEERGAWLDRIARIDLLVLDEVGRTSSGKGAQDAFFRLIDARYEAVRPTLLTTNLDREGLIEVLGDAAYDRLRQGGTELLTLEWASARAQLATDGDLR